MFHILNRSKGAAVWVSEDCSYSFAYNQSHSSQGLRAQIDRKLYKKHMQELLFDYPNLDVKAASVHDLLWSRPSASYVSGDPVSNGSIPVEPTVWAQVAGVRLSTTTLISHAKHSLKK